MDNGEEIPALWGAGDAFGRDDRSMAVGMGIDGAKKVARE